MFRRFLEVLRDIRWEMLTSHHPPELYEGRVVWFGKVPVCVRCLGMWLGMFWVLFPLRSFFFPSTPLLLILFSLPATFDFLSHETGLRHSNALVRFVTGLIFGVPLAFAADALFSLRLFETLLILLWFGILQLGCGYVLLKTGNLGTYLARYEAGVRRHGCRCGEGPECREMCGCKEGVRG